MLQCIITNWTYNSQKWPIMYNTTSATTPNLNQFIVNALILNDMQDGQNLILFDCLNVVLVAEV